MRNIECMYDRLLCEKVSEDETVTTGGIVIAGKEEPGAAWKARVIAIGPGAWFGSEYVETSLKPGDMVYIPPHSEYKVVIKGKTYYSLRESMVLFKVIGENS